MRRASSYLLMSLGLVVSLLYVPSASAAPSALPTVTYKRYLTKLAPGANTLCATWQDRGFSISGHLASGQKFVELHRFYLRLTSGKTVASTGMRILNTRSATWWVPVSRTAKISRYFSGSYTHVETQGGATFTAVASRSCSPVP